MSDPPALAQINLNCIEDQRPSLLSDDTLLVYIVGQTCLIGQLEARILEWFSYTVRQPNLGNVLKEERGGGLQPHA